MLKRLLLALFMTGIAALVSCENYKNCNSPTDASLGISFASYRQGLAADTSLPALVLYGLGRQDSLLSDGAPARQIFVPLDPATDSSRFYIQPDSSASAADTLTVLYRPDRHFVSAGCGFTYFYAIDSIRYTRHLIDSAALLASHVNTSHATQITLYYP